MDNSGVVVMNEVYLFEDTKESYGGIRMNPFDFVSRMNRIDIVGVKDT
jgi:hypothetical protein